MKYPSRRCEAHRSTDGKPCGNFAIRGGNVCVAHGGSADHVRQAADRRLLAAVDPVIDQLLDLALHAKNEMVRLRACIDVLDRCGLQPVRKIEVNELSDELIDAEIERLLKELKELEEDDR